MAVPLEGMGASGTPKRLCVWGVDGKEESSLLSKGGGGRGAARTGSWGQLKCFDSFFQEQEIVNDFEAIIGLI